MKKLIFLAALSLFLGFSTFSTAHDTKVSVYPMKRTQVIVFTAFYGNGNWVYYSNLYINGQFVFKLIYGPVLVLANIGDTFDIYDLGSSASAHGVITSTQMDVILR